MNRIMTPEQVIIQYFGEDVVEHAVMEYFNTHGLTEETADNLSMMTIVRPKEFCELVSNYVDRNTKYMADESMADSR